MTGSADSGGRGGARTGPGAGSRGPRIPGPGPAAGGPAGDPVPPPGPPPEPDPPHETLRSLLGAWALAACSAEESAAVGAHLAQCAPCADEALRLRDAVGLLHGERDLDLDPALRTRVLENCLVRRPARVPVPCWAGPYDAETARLDALLRDIGREEWRAPVRLGWFEEGRRPDRRTDVTGVIGHLFAVDGLVAAALGLGDPVEPVLAGRPPHGPVERTEVLWRALARDGEERCVRAPWRDQAHALVRAVSSAGSGAAELPVPYGPSSLSLRDALVERAFECWVHAEDIASAVDYPYEPPSGAHLREMVGLAVRLLPAALSRRRAGSAQPARETAGAGARGRALRLEVEGAGGGRWHVALDPRAAAGPEEEVALVALDGVEFCRLVAGRVTPEEAAAGQEGDREAVREVLYAAASLSRM
ncbi:maleylpyruvate isomerase N-terminal domain-containing protein [Streptomyces sudanensis]|uniref:maleylpyruvate isomerase N-terminal domain-containing protein n=1 Tax=Streptomyces sudanensis TaxID=436397 RepID=UPI0020CF2CCA|nr:maleylpyruvate isomerase N-terminal domain-containing protein [Streptomyces sudanensis]MCP9958518.1 maleylpyruvate isomerase N-terminal domain-containing protein [Streptomyces sudanensis]